MSKLKLICQNKKATHDYHIEETFEAGLILTGPEVKSLRMGKATISDSYAKISWGEAFLIDTHISPYPFSSQQDPDPKRTRKLLLHKGEIKRLLGKSRQKGYSLIPLRLYFRDGKAKVEIGLAKGKRLYDRREDLKRKDQQREIDRAMRRKK
jgi:SsrA-binding protein